MSTATSSCPPQCCCCPKFLNHGGPGDDSISSFCGCARCCSFPNGWAAIVTAGAFLLLGIGFTTASLVDCQFVHVNAALADPFLATLFPPDDPRSNMTLYYAAARKKEHTHLGYFIFEDVTKSCAYDMHYDYKNPLYNETSNGEVYHDFLQGWDTGRGCAVWSGFMALVCLIWLSTWTCWAHSKVFRYAWVWIVCPGIATVQSLALLPLGSDFCDEYDCGLGRSAGFSIASVVCYIGSALVVACGTRDYETTNNRNHFKSSSSRRRDHHDDDDRRRNNNNPYPAEQDDLEQDGVGNAQEVPIDDNLLQAMVLENKGLVVGGATTGSDESVTEQQAAAAAAEEVAVIAAAPPDNEANATLP